jgi:hypothetical protein
VFYKASEKLCLSDLKVLQQNTMLGRPEKGSRVTELGSGSQNAGLGETQRVRVKGGREFEVLDRVEGLLAMGDVELE